LFFSLPLPEARAPTGEPMSASLYCADSSRPYSRETLVAIDHQPFTLEQWKVSRHCYEWLWSIATWANGTFPLYLYERWLEEGLEWRTMILIGKSWLLHKSCMVTILLSKARGSEGYRKIDDRDWWLRRRQERERIVRYYKQVGVAFPRDVFALCVGSWVFPIRIVCVEVAGDWRVLICDISKE